MLRYRDLLRSAPNENVEVKRRNRIRMIGSYLSVPLLLWLVYETAEPNFKPWLMRSAGALFMALGLAIRIWALGCIDGRKKKVLVTWGPYRFVRHPLYCGSLLLGVGACTFAGAPLAGLVFIVIYVVLYLPSVRAEEQFLAYRFSEEWGPYSSAVPAIVPRPGSVFPASADAAPFRWPFSHLFQPVLLCGVAILASELFRSGRFLN